MNEIEEEKTKRVGKVMLVLLLAIFPLTTLIAGWIIWVEKFSDTKLSNLMFFVLCFIIPLIYNLWILILFF
jgi:uncharacterized membrane protein YhaH (DUF805 family)